MSENPRSVFHDGKWFLLWNNGRVRIDIVKTLRHIKEKKEMTTKETMLKEVCVYENPSIVSGLVFRQDCTEDGFVKYIIASEYERLRKQADALAEQVKALTRDNDNLRDQIKGDAINALKSIGFLDISWREHNDGN